MANTTLKLVKNTSVYSNDDIMRLIDIVIKTVHSIQPQTRLLRETVEVSSCRSDNIRVKKSGTRLLIAFPAKGNLSALEALAHETTHLIKPADFYFLAKEIARRLFYSFRFMNEQVSRELAKIDYWPISARSTDVAKAEKAKLFAIRDAVERIRLESELSSLESELRYTQDRIRYTQDRIRSCREKLANIPKKESTECAP